MQDEVQAASNRNRVESLVLIEIAIESASCFTQSFYPKWENKANQPNQTEST